MKVSYIITQNKFNAILNQETTEIKVSFKTGYYPLPGGGGGDLSNYYTKDETYSKTEVDDIIADIPVVDTSNLVPYTGANKDVNIGAYYFESSQGFKKTGGTSSQYLMADGSTSTLPTDLVKGTGTTNYIPKFTASGTLSNSQIQDDGIGIGIGSAPSSTDNLYIFSSTNKSSLRLRTTHSSSNSEINFQTVSGSAISMIDYGGNYVFRTYQADMFFDNFSTTGGIRFRTAGNNERMRIASNGNVGIGTTTLSEKLEVDGYTKATGFKTPNGTANQSLTANGGVFDLNTKADLVGGKVPSSQLPSYVDDVLEFANLASFPVTGESGKIYIAIDTNVTYRWTGAGYAEISASLALGETPSTAYRGDRGKIAYDHSQVTHDKNLVGLGNVDNTSDLNKPISNATQTALDLKLSIESQTTTGTLISFSIDRVYGTLTTPETGNITADVTNAKLGVTNIVIHNSGTAPTFGSGFKKLSGSGNYTTGVVNYIYCTYISATEIIYSINQRA